MLIHPSHLFFIISIPPLPLIAGEELKLPPPPHWHRSAGSSRRLCSHAPCLRMPRSYATQQRYLMILSLPFLHSPPLLPSSHSSFVCLSFSQLIFSTLSDIFETMYFASLEASMELAKVEGPYSTYEGSPMSRGVIQPGKLTSEDRSSSTFSPYYFFLHHSIPFPSL